MAASNVFYDANNDSIPLQAFEITNSDGEPLSPFLLTSAGSQAESYVLDVTSLTSGTGVKPYHRGEELSASSSRAWRMDYYKPDAQSGVLWTTVFSGPMQQLADGTYELTVDLGLRWSEEGDNLNRLNQGAFSHIALAVGDFRSFNMKILTPGSVQLVANVISQPPTSVPTSAPATSLPSSPPSSAPSQSPTELSSTSSPTAPALQEATTAVTQASSTETFAARLFDTTTEEPDDKLDILDQDYGYTYGKGGKGKKGKNDKGYDCDYEYGTKGKKKKGKKCKKGKQSSGDLQNTAYRSGSIAFGTAAVAFFVSGWVLVTYRRRHVHDGYEPIADSDESMVPIASIPTEFGVFGSYSIDELKLAASKMREPPTSNNANF